jgi:hypothetical protein
MEMLRANTNKSIQPPLVLSETKFINTEMIPIEQARGKTP